LIPNVHDLHKHIESAKICNTVFVDQIIGSFSQLFGKEEKYER
jgi:hypothetical protein